MIALSKMAASVQPSATLAAAAKARQLKAAGVHVFDFSLGEPDFPTPSHICDAADRAAKAGQTHYTPASGTPELRKAIADWYGRFHGLKVDAAQVLVSNGAKHSIHNSLAATVGPGDEVIIPTPYWVSYSELVEMTGAKPVLVRTTAESGFKMTAEQLRAAISPRARLLMLNSPCNPTGAVYSRGELAKLADVVMGSEISVLSDEIYEQLTYGDARPTCFATLRPGLEQRTITISGASKSYAMTGWRMGWAVGPKPVIDAMGNVQSQQTSCPSSVSQCALLAALNGPQECVGQMRTEFARRREIVCAHLAKIPGVRFTKPDGAFYAFFDVSAYFGKPLAGGPVRDSADFCRAALAVAHVNLVQGSAFGCEGFVRMSFATSTEQIEGGLTNLQSWLAGKPLAA
jgi:aspartate aminotransferase